VTMARSAEGWTGALVVIEAGLARCQPGALTRLRDLRRAAAQELRDMAKDLRLKGERLHQPRADTTDVLRRIGQRIAEVKRRLVDIDQLLERYGKTKRLPSERDDYGPTPEAVVQAAHPARRDPIAAMKLDDHLKVAAESLRRVFEAVTAGLFARPASLLRGSGGGRAAIPEKLARLHHEVYLPWTKEMQRKRLSLPVVIDVVIDGRSLASIAAERGMGHVRVAAIVRRGLELYERRLSRRGGGR